MAFILSDKRKIGDECDEEGRYDKRRRLARDTPPFDDFKRLSDSKAGGGGGGGGPQHVFAADATLLTDEIKKKMSDKHGGAIHSEGRGQPTYPLSRIHETVAFDASAFDKRQRGLPAEYVCPLGPREAFGIQPGALLYELAGKSAGFRSNSMRPGKDSAGRGVAGFGQRLVFDCVNGLNRNERLMFSGMSLTATSSTDPQSDPAVTVASSGTVTVVNTGPTTLLPGHTAMFLATPYSVVVNGTMKPGIQEKGVHPEKFRPMIVMADELLSPEIAVRAQRAAREVLTGKPAMTADDMQGYWLQARQKLRTVVIDRNLDEQARTGMQHDLLWIDIYLAWYMLRTGALIAGTGFQQGEEEKFFNAVEDAHWQLAGIGEYAEKQLGVHSPRYWDSFTGINNIQNRFEYIQLQQVRALADHRSQITQRCIGRIMNLSPPGQPLDLCLGYFNV